MKQILLVFFLLSSYSASALATSVTEAAYRLEELQESDDPTLDVEQQSESSSEVATQKSKILIAGDSWAFFTCIYNSMGKMIRDKKAHLSEDNRCWRTSKVGLTAEEWLTTRSHKRTLKFIQKSPRIKYLYLSLGGNDLMRHWNKDFTHEQELELYEKTSQTLQKIMNTYLAVRPDIKIILAGYDYPNFTFKFTLPLYRTIHKRMHHPDPERLNNALVEFTKYVARLNNGNNIFYIHSMGLAQYYYGVPEKGLAPQQTECPEQISTMNDPGAVGGITAFQNSKKCMINWLFIVRDSFHMNTRMYRKVMHHVYDNLLVHLLEREQQEQSQPIPLLQTAN